MHSQALDGESKKIHYNPKIKKMHFVIFGQHIIIRCYIRSVLDLVGKEIGVKGIGMAFGLRNIILIFCCVSL